MRPELTALCDEHRVTRDDLDRWLDSHRRVARKELGHKHLSPDLVYAMLIWRSVERGDLVYNGDGTFSLPEETNE